MSYTKKLATITIVTPDGSFTVQDTADCMKASMALAQLQKGKGVYVDTDDDLYFVMPSAVSFVKIEYTDSEEITPSDPC